MLYQLSHASSSHDMVDLRIGCLSYITANPIRHLRLPICAE
jgi:hypothetical protein